MVRHTGEYILRSVFADGGLKGKKAFILAVRACRGHYSGE